MDPQTTLASTDQRYVYSKEVGRSSSEYRRNTNCTTATVTVTSADDDDVNNNHHTVIDEASPSSPFHCRYKITSEIGRGSFSTVYEVLDTVTGHRRAAKFIPITQQPSSGDDSLPTTTTDSVSQGSANSSNDVAKKKSINVHHQVAAATNTSPSSKAGPATTRAMTASSSASSMAAMMMATMGQSSPLSSSVKQASLPKKGSAATTTAAATHDSTTTVVGEVAVVRQPCFASSSNLGPTVRNACDHHHTQKQTPTSTKNNRTEEEGTGLEDSLLLSLRHPNIASILDVYRTSTYTIIVMELIDGGELFSLVESRYSNNRDSNNHHDDEVRHHHHHHQHHSSSATYHSKLQSTTPPPHHQPQHRLSEEEVRGYLKQLLSAVEYLHTVKGIVHRDIKLENILLCSGRRRNGNDVSEEGDDDDDDDDDDDEAGPHVVLVDFGLSRVVGDTKVLNSCCGSPNYMSPEMLRSTRTQDQTLLPTNHGRYGREVDIWAVGVVFYLLLTGKYPFYDERKSVWHRSILKGQYQVPPPQRGHASSHYRHDNEGGEQETENTIGWSAEALHLLSQLLDVDSSRRITATEALCHPFFHSSTLSHSSNNNNNSSTMTTSSATSTTMTSPSVVSSLSFTQSSSSTTGSNTIPTASSSSHCKKSATHQHSTLVAVAAAAAQPTKSSSSVGSSAAASACSTPTAPTLLATSSATAAAASAANEDIACSDQDAMSYPRDLASDQHNATPYKQTFQL